MALHTTFEKRVYSLPDGNYSGTIKHVSIKGERLFMSIEIGETKEIFRTSFPATLCSNHPITELILLSDITEEEIPNFDLEKLIGTKVNFETFAVEKNGKKFCNTNNFSITD